MVRIATCPSCLQPVSIPEGVDPDCPVRCPICEAEYPLADASVETEEVTSPEAVGSLEILQQEAYGSQSPPTPPELIPVANLAGPSEPPSAEPPEQTPPSSSGVTEEEEELLLAEPSQESLPEAESLPEIGASEQEAPVSEGVGEETEGAITLETPSSEAEALEGAVPEEGPTPETIGEAAPSESPEGAPSESVASEEAPSEQLPPLDLDPMVRSPFSQEAFPLSQLIVEATGEPIGPVAAGMIVRHGLLRPISEEEAAEMASAEAPAAEEAPGEFDFGTFAPAVEGGGGGVPISVRPRKRAEINPVKEMIGIVLGGALGLLIGYYLLNIFGGARFNFLEVYLPGVKHTYKYAPNWLPAWAKGGQPASTEPADPNAPSSGNKATSRPSSGKSPPAPPANNAGPPAEKAPSQSDGHSSSAGSEKSAVPPPAEKPKAKPSASKGEPSGKSPPGEPSASASSGFPLQVIGAPSYTPDDLGQALQGVLEVFGCKQCNSTGQQTKTVTEVQQVDGQPKEVSKTVRVPCEACKGQPPKTITEEALTRFSRLAEVLCFVTGPEEKGVLEDQRLAARTLLERVAEDPGNPEKIGPQAESLWNDAGRLSMGILAAGKLGRMEPHGPWQQYEFQLAGTDRKVPLVVSGPPPAAEGDTVLVLGCIVEDPGESLRQYSGKASVVLVGAVLVKAP